MREAYFFFQQSLTQKLVPQTLRVSVMLLFFPLSVYFLHISFHMCIFSVHTTARSDKLHFGLVDMG